jgi:hypothetical protein
VVGGAIRNSSTLKATRVQVEEAVVILLVRNEQVCYLLKEALFNLDEVMLQIDVRTCNCDVGLEIVDDLLRHDVLLEVLIISRNLLVIVPHVEVVKLVQGLQSV